LPALILDVDEISRANNLTTIMIKMFSIERERVAEIIIASRKLETGF